MTTAQEIAIRERLSVLETTIEQLESERADFPGKIADTPVGDQAALCVAASRYLNLDLYMLEIRGNIMWGRMLLTANSQQEGSDVSLALPSLKEWLDTYGEWYQQTANIFFERQLHGVSTLLNAYKAYQEAMTGYNFMVECIEKGALPNANSSNDNDR